MNLIEFTLLVIHSFIQQAPILEPTLVQVIGLLLEGVPWPFGWGQPDAWVFHTPTSPALHSQLPTHRTSRPSRTSRPEGSVEEEGLTALLPKAKD